jgi:acyl carrier protein
MSTALLVVDLQNAFCRPEGSFARRGLSIDSIGRVVDRCRSLVEHARRSDWLVVLTRLVYAADYRDAGLLVDRNPGIRALGAYREGSFDAELVAELLPVAGDSLVVRKTRYDPFLGTGLEAELRARDVGDVVVCGGDDERLRRVDGAQRSRPRLLRPHRRGCDVVLRPGPASRVDRHDGASFRDADRPRGPDRRARDRARGGRAVSPAEDGDRGRAIEAIVEVVRCSQGLSDTEPLDGETILLDRGLALDSVALLDLVLALEARFSIRLADADVQATNFETIARVAALIDRVRHA